MHLVDSLEKETGDCCEDHSFYIERLCAGSCAFEWTVLTDAHTRGDLPGLTKRISHLFVIPCYWTIHRCLLTCPQESRASTSLAQNGLNTIALGTSSFNCIKRRVVLCTNWVMAELAGGKTNTTRSSKKKKNVWCFFFFFWVLFFPPPAHWVLWKGRLSSPCLCGSSCTNVACKSYLPM